MLHGYVVNYLILSFFQAEAPNVVSALPITFMFRKGIEACWVLTRKIKRTKKKTNKDAGSTIYRSINASTWSQLWQFFWRKPE